jgi:vacuolar-type H+-ATPase subunit B/Vma2
MSATDLGVNEVLGVSRIEGPLVFVEGIGSVAYDEVVSHRLPDSYSALKLAASR